MTFLLTVVCVAAACGGSVQLGDSSDGRDAAAQGDAKSAAEGGSSSSADAAIDANGGSDAAGVCTPDPPDALISGTGGGQPDAPYCPWGSCLDGPKASCGADGQWHCPAPPPSCTSDGGFGGGSMCTQKGGVCVLGNQPCPSGTLADGIPSPDGECGVSMGPAYLCCVPLPDAGPDAGDAGATDSGCSGDGCPCTLGGSTCGAGLFCCNPISTTGTGYCAPLNNPCQ